METLITKPIGPTNGLPQAPIHSGQPRFTLAIQGIAVSEDRAYTLGNFEGDDLIQCLDVTTGQLIWSENYPQDLIPKYNPGGPQCPTCHR